ncbi:MAG: hypothetical protein EAZ74_03200 [Alphaproteobacteria bacterium]|nr:MAG: hypothetical protein EAY76_00505 [Alphaproteobacteria bacterium]TAF14753.1 MAG: hypothetical protein EAZ74_03200 [Alphaproteobacteria bacterium]TAF40678.1 MAG: hypothetical protein EAZ66_02620 [Alphaproteobacteria bacterium]TAF76091.1 MAG: hypothetical protein EAZ52_05195 [Alphaproteobacteria bacterium]
MAQFITFAGDAPFLQALAKHIAQCEARTRIVLPTQRSILALKRMIFAQSNAPSVVLPQFYAVKDMRLIDWLPPHHPALRTAPPTIYGEHQRLAWVLDALQQRPDMRDKPLSFRVQSAQSFLALRDECQRVQKGVDDMMQVIAQEEYAHHWQQNLALFMELMHHMDEQVVQHGGVEPIIHAHYVSNQIAEWWRTDMLDDVIIFAGSTCSTPTTATLLHALTHQPHAQIIFPALDTQMSEEIWQQLHVMHPMATMKHWLDKAKIERTMIHMIGTLSPREAWIAQVMIPEAASHRLVDAVCDVPIHDAIELSEYVTDHEESLGIALTIRHALEEGVRSIMIICEDDRFIEQVCAHMHDYAIPINHSAGMRAMAHPALRFLLLITELLTCPYQSQSLLALMRHPLFCPDMREEMHELAAWMDAKLLRGFHMFDSVEAVGGALEQREKGALLRAFVHHAFTYRVHAPSTLGDAMQHLLACVRAMSAGESKQRAMHEVLEQCCRALEHISAACAHIRLASPYDMRALVHHYLGDIRIQQITDEYAPVHILGSLEARLMSADMVIIPRMNSGVWPSYPTAEPWLNRAMRRRLGMDFAERKMGLAAHDVMMALRAPRVLCSRALRDRGSPTQPSPLFERIRMMHPSGGGAKKRDEVLVYRAHQQHQHVRTPVALPAPCPPVAWRMRTLYATTMETLLHQPYAVYVSHILKLKERDPIDAPYSPLVFGQMMHDVMQRAAQHYQPHDLETYLASMRQAVMEEVLHHVKEAERPFIARQMQRMIAHVAEEECNRARTMITLHAEQNISYVWHNEHGETMTIAARMDRVEYLHGDAVRIVDYKTGTPPHPKEVWEGYRVQLVMAGYMMLHQEQQPKALGFDYWDMSGKLSDNASLVQTRLAVGDEDGLAILYKRGEELMQCMSYYCLHPEARYVWNLDEHAQSYRYAAHLARVGEW